MLRPSPGNAQSSLRTMPSLKIVKVPTPSNLDRYVRDNAALVVLGKAFFWDVQASSDGRVACGTCHFHAGAVRSSGAVRADGACRADGGFAVPAERAPAR